MIKCSPVPVSSVNICRYAAFLARNHALSTVKQYMNIIRILHLECGIENPVSTWELKSVLGGVKRKFGDISVQKSPILPCHLRLVHDHLNLNDKADIQFWAVF